MPQKVSIREAEKLGRTEDGKGTASKQPQRKRKGRKEGQGSILIDHEAQHRNDPFRRSKQPSFARQA